MPMGFYNGKSLLIINPFLVQHVAVVKRVFLGSTVYSKHALISPLVALSKDLKFLMVLLEALPDILLHHKF